VDISKQDYIEEDHAYTPEEVLVSCVQRRSYNVAELVANTPIRLHPKKRIVYEKAYPENRVLKGCLLVSRYEAVPLSPLCTVDTEFEMREDVFNYVPCPSRDVPVVEWWLNFADSNLFVAYGGALFAQDEMQVAEHPSLAHLKEKLEEDGNLLLPKTRVDGRGTPILIRNIERCCSVAVDANAEEGRPRGLYGNVFSRSPDSVINTATIVLDPPTITNMIAMASLSGGSGTYTWEQIVDLYTTAYTAFKAAQVESRMSCNNEAAMGPVIPYVVIHTGNWGCGAFGGNRPLMAILQLLAAKSAGINKLVYHTFNKEGTEGYATGKKIFDSLIEKKIEETEETFRVKDILEACTRLDFQWGHSDGN